MKRIYLNSPQNFLRELYPRSQTTVAFIPKWSMNIKQINISNEE